MATKLKNLRITKVDFVKEGANPEADIKLYKSKDGKAGEHATEPDDIPKEGVLKRLMTYLSKAFSTEDIEGALDALEKGGSETFGQKMSEVKRRKITDEMWDICYALQSSLSSIIADDDLNGSSATELMTQSLQEFQAVMQPAIENGEMGKRLVLKTQRFQPLQRK